MKKKMITILIIVAVVIGAAFAWRVAYAVRKSTDNLPTLEMLAEMDDASFLVGYRSNQLISVWGEPDEESYTTIGTTMLHWEIDDDTVLRVHIDDKDKVAYYFLDTGE